MNIELTTLYFLQERAQNAFKNPKTTAEEQQYLIGVLHTLGYLMNGYCTEKLSFLVLGRGSE